MTKKVKTFTDQEYERFITDFMHTFFLAKEIWWGIKSLIKCANLFPEVYKRKQTFFGAVYRALVYDFKGQLMKLVDETNSSYSLIKLLKEKSKTKPWKADPKALQNQETRENEIRDKIANSQTFKKIKNYRDLVISHRPKTFIVTAGSAEKFHADNNTTEEEIADLLDLLEEAIRVVFDRTDISLSIKLNPSSSIQIEIEDFFKELSALACVE